MTKQLNYNRPGFRQHDLWRKHDQYESAGQARRRQVEQSKPVDSSSLEMLLLAYSGTNDKLLSLQGKAVRGASLSARDSHWAYKRLTAFARASAAVAQLIELGCRCAAVEAVLAIPADVMTAGQVGRLEKHAERCGRTVEVPAGLVFGRRPALAAGVSPDASGHAAGR